MECLHIDVRKNGYCRGCKNFIEREDVPEKKKKIKSISDILRKISIKRDIKIMANEIYQTLEVGNLKLSRKTEASCYCIIVSYIKLERIIDPVIIGNMFNFTKKEVEKLILQYSELDPIAKEEKYDFYVEEKDMLLYYWDYLNIGEEEDREELIEKYDLFFENGYYEASIYYSSRLFVLSFLYAYINYRGYNINNFIDSLYIQKEKFIGMKNDILQIMLDEL